MRPLGEDAGALRIVRAPAIGTDEAGRHEVFQGVANLHGFARVVSGEMKLIKVDAIGAKTSRRGFAGSSYKGRSCIGTHDITARFVEHVAGLRRKQDLVSPADECE